MSIINTIVNYNLILYNINFYLFLVFLILCITLFIIFKKSNRLNKKNGCFLLFLVFIFGYNLIPYIFEFRAQSCLKSKPQNLAGAIKNRELAARLSINPLDKAMLYNDSAVLYALKNDYKAVLNSHNKAVKYINNQDMTTTIVLSKICEKNSDYELALKFLLNKIRTEAYWQNRMILYYYLADFYTKLGSYKQAYTCTNNYLRLYNRYKDILYLPCDMIEKRIALSNKLKKYDFAKKDEAYLQQFCKSKKRKL